MAEVTGRNLAKESSDDVCIGTSVYSKVISSDRSASECSNSHVSQGGLWVRLREAEMDPDHHD